MILFFMYDELIVGKYFVSLLFIWSICDILKLSHDETDMGADHYDMHLSGMDYQKKNNNNVMSSTI